jgi:homoserine O-succinyltransferase
MPHAEPADRAPLRILLVNSMADGALQRTERQFARLLQPGPEDPPVQWVQTTLPEIARGEWGKAHVAENYIPLDRALALGADVVVLTGAEPRSPALEDEPYWKSLTRVFDWAAAGAVPALCSCLAAHAALQHFDGIRRVRLPEKCFGLFEHEHAADDPLLRHLPPVVTVPHSRWNHLEEASLVAAGYQVMTRSAVGIDLFARNGASRWLLFQGHPEYDPETLWREYQRDVRRYIEREQDRYPALPVGIGTADEIATLERHRRSAEGGAALADLPTASIPQLPSPSPLNAVIRDWFAEIRAALTIRSTSDATIDRESSVPKVAAPSR